MNKATTLTTAALGSYAGLLSAAHGVLEMLQGNVATDGVMISAIGPPCQAETAWHACFPAMTLVPNFLITGALAVVASLATLIWSASLIARPPATRRRPIVLAALAILMLLVGGGFVPMFTGLIATLAYTGISLPATLQRPLAKLWPWPLIVYFLWIPVQWVVGYVGGSYLANAGLLFFLLFDLSLPLLTALTALAHTKLRTANASGG
jgi:hypothetical protein